MKAPPDPFYDKAYEVLHLGARVVTDTVEGGPYKRYELERMARGVPAVDVTVIKTVADALRDVERHSDDRFTPIKEDLEAQIAKERHDKEYWQGRAPQAVDDMQEQAAMLAEKAGNPRLAAEIRALRIGW